MSDMAEIVELHFKGLVAALRREGMTDREIIDLGNDIHRLIAKHYQSGKTYTLDDEAKEAISAALDRILNRTVN